MSKVILLAALDEPLPPLQLPDGRTVAIRQIDGIGMQILNQTQQGEFQLIWDVAARCLPELTIEQVRAFTLTQARQIVEVACGSAERVLADIERPTAPAETGPTAQPSAIPSAS
jgi:hypothetical protein